MASQLRTTGSACMRACKNNGLMLRYQHEYAPTRQRATHPAGGRTRSGFATTQMSFVQEGDKGFSVKELVLHRRKHGVLREGIHRRHKRVTLFATLALMIPDGRHARRRPRRARHIRCWAGGWGNGRTRRPHQARRNRRATEFRASERAQPERKRATIAHHRTKTLHSGGFTTRIPDQTVDTRRRQREELRSSAPWFGPSFARRAARRTPRVAGGGVWLGSRVQRRDIDRKLDTAPRRQASSNDRDAPVVLDISFEAAVQHVGGDGCTSLATNASGSLFKRCAPRTQVAVGRATSPGCGSPAHITGLTRGASSASCAPFLSSRPFARTSRYLSATRVADRNIWFANGIYIFCG